VYTATYTAQTAGENQKATLKLDGWTESSISDAYAITHGQAAQANSSVLVDGSSFVSGSDMTVFVSLLDAQGNPVIGQASSLKDAVTVPNATLSSAWTDNRDGPYPPVDLADKAGENLKAKLKFAEWTESSTSDAYAITAGVAEQANSSVLV